ncbi:hypothetical protein [Paracoccus shanxieyensis]|uniref:Uncharacterized protein n=1 Tax=Paracoccus shanxieyensis TaxID=2675752 RepID=A0A6L6J2T8_9RHOB|nr:hypothetical protein [Paracoccus shanxieyensis]MTH65074.1 hypothetical protein [Paracoccus shanxieyensis]MTH88218.1 hypothetical protein [Paracoccus shanxieyensis]
MPSARFQPSFAAGVIGPGLWGRIDLAKYDTAIKRGVNCFVHAHGGISNRPGLRFICEVMDSTQRHRLMPFVREVDDSAVLIFGNQQLGFISDGQRVQSGGADYTIATPWLAGQVNAIDAVQSVDVIFAAHRATAPRRISRLGPANWTVSTVPINPTTPIPVITEIEPRRSGEETYSYRLTAIVGGVESFPSTVQTFTGAELLSNEGAMNVIRWNAVPGATEYRVYRMRNGVAGYIGFTTAGLAFVDDNISADLTVTPPVQAGLFSTPDNFPSVVSIHQQRLVFGATNNRPETVWLSRTGDYLNFTRSQNMVATDRAEFDLAGEQLNRIRGMLQLRELLVFTSSGEFSVTGPEGGFDATNPIVTQYGYVGSAAIKPLVADDTALFVERSGRGVRDLRYAYESDGYSGNDLTIFASHFFEGRRIIAWAMAKAPWSLIWVVLDNGKLLAMTYKREHQVWAWTEMDIDGSVESVACVPENSIDATYVIVRRTVGGVQRRYVERFDDRAFSTATDAFFVDCGITYRGSATTTITGLEHLEGRTVSALADGDHVRGLIVTGGAVTLPFAASVVHVGLPYVAEFETLPPAIQFDDVGAARGRPHNVSGVKLQMEKTRGIKTVTQDGRSNEIVQTGGDLAEVIALWTGIHNLSVPTLWNKDGTVTIRQDYPLPMTILGISVDLSIGRS